MRLMVTSRAYGLSSRYDEAAWSEGYTPLYARKLARRLDAEEIFDAMASATGIAAREFGTPFSSTMALPGPNEPQPRYGASDDGWAVQDFLRNFGRGDRYVTDRSRRTTIAHALHLFNNWLVTARLYGRDEAFAGRLGEDVARGRVAPAEAVSRMYLSTLGRRPSPAETAALAPRVRDRESAADLQWALLNRVDFLYNY
jgi:hypothetical protein